MARVRNNQGFRKKALDLHIRPYLEQEQTQEREAFLQAREVIKPLQDETWKLAKTIVRRHYTVEDVKMAYHLQNKFENVDTIAKDSCFHFGYYPQKDVEDKNQDDDDNKDAYITKHFDFRLDGNINGQESSRTNNFAFAYFRDELKAKLIKGRNVILILTLNKSGEMVVARKTNPILIGLHANTQMKGNWVCMVVMIIKLFMQENGMMITN